MAARTNGGKEEEKEQKSVIVTGASRGIGKAIALRLAADGYNVCVNDLEANRAGCEAVVRAVRQMGRRSCCAIADVSDRSEVKEMVRTSVERLGPLNTMIANAGIAHVKRLLEVTEADFARTLAVNVAGVHNCLAEAAAQMRAQGTCTPLAPGKLIAAASAAAFRPARALPHYSASKWAVRGLTQAYALELAEHHITANAYAPGIVATDMWDGIDEAAAERYRLQRGAFMRRTVEETSALKRVSVPEDVAGLVSFLAGGDSNFVTGQTLLVDGGINFS
ncbi:hypothetical protein F4778DRAFT_799629 [Xylariomycetidae sp. FL2044]|nr:hypothetical protein F4778DRAFT_799629 [Xylariomycetidae sp. FL2044]